MGYESHRESVEVKFPYGDATRAIVDGSICFVDGYTKILIMVGVCTFCHQLDTGLAIYDPVLHLGLQ